MSQTIGEALLAYQNEKIIEKMSKNAAIKTELELIQEYTSDKLYFGIAYASSIKNDERGLKNLKNILPVILLLYRMQIWNISQKIIPAYYNPY